MEVVPPGLRKEVVDVTALLDRILVWFASHGVTVGRVMTDNGSAYKSRLFASALTPMA